MSQTIRLGVNIDHVATLRQARGELYPSLVAAAVQVMDSGADQITIHLREDRRHIQDTDVSAIKMVTDRYNKPLNLELGINEEILQIAIEVNPAWVCIVPEKREEKTTEGGLNLKDEKNFKRIQQACNLLKEQNPAVKISLFVEADTETLNLCLKLNIDAVEIHTGDFAKAILEGNPVESYLQQFQEGKKIIEDHHLGYHAGHGLTDESLKPLVKHNLFKEYNIGHWIVCDSIFNGLDKSIKKLIKIINNNDI